MEILRFDARQFFLYQRRRHLMSSSPEPKAKFPSQRQDAILSGIGALIGLGIFSWTAASVFRKGGSLRPALHVSGWYLPDVQFVIAMGLLSFGLAWRAVDKWRSSRRKPSPEDETPTDDSP
jgi:hypothetical protein